MKLVKQTDPSAIVVPFGKHKGATVAELLAKDASYADWILSQGWVAERFAELHAALATRGAGTDDTPEHNALQARFLEEKFRKNLVWFINHRRITEFLNSAIKEILSDRADKVKRKQSDIAQSLSTRTYYAKYNSYRETVARIDKDIARARTELIELTKAVDGPAPKISDAKLATQVKFEQKGVDVVLTWQIKLPEYGPLQDRLLVELKPSLGDDYPSVLRQMQRLGCDVLVLDQYTGRGVSEPQLRQMFEANGLSLVFVQEIEELMRLPRE